MNAIIDAALSRSRTVLLTLAMLLITGFYSYVMIPKESAPDVNIPIIYTSLSLRGISPEDAERLLVRPMEQELRSVEGVKEMRSSSFLGGANVVLEFEAGFDADQALSDVREKVDDAKADLPQEADDPTVHEVNLSLFPIVTIVLSGDAPERSLLKIARALKDEIESLHSVLEVNIGGDRDEQVDVIIDPLKIESYEIGTSQILQNIANFNTLVAAGSIDTGQGGFNVKVPGLFETEEDIMNMPFQVNGDATAKIRDIAEVRRTFIDPKGFAQYNGNRAISLEVKKRTGENIIETIAYTKAIVNAFTKNLPPSIHIDFYGDRSKDIKNMLDDLQNNIISAILLVMIIVVAALGLRSAGLVGISIPGSFLTGIFVLYAMGLTMNTVVLFSLILSVGMLVDGAIVLTEYADVKLREGHSPFHAYGMAAKRMAWPIIASTATTLAAFLPLLFWPGVVGEFMKFMPITLLATLSASLFMALIFVPVLGKTFTKHYQIPENDKGKKDIFDIVSVHYKRILSRALRYPGKIVGAAFISLIFVWTLYANIGKGVEFFPDIEPELAVLQIHGQGNFSVHEKKALVDEIESIVLKIKEEKGEIEAVYTRSGELGESDTAKDVIGTIQLRFSDWKQRRPAGEILKEIVELSKSSSGIKVDSHKMDEGPPAGSPIAIQLKSKDKKAIKEMADRIIAKLNTIDGLRNIDDGFNIAGIEWELNVDRSQAVKFGLDIAAVGDFIQLITNGTELTTFRPDNSDDEIKVVVRYPEKYRNISQLNNIRISTPNGNIPIVNFVERSAQPKVGVIEKTDSMLSQDIKADVEEGILANDKIIEIQEWLNQIEIPDNVMVSFKGEDEEQKKAAAFLSKAFLIALFLITIILVTQFNRFYSAFLILTAVIMSTVGVFIGLLITGQPFGIVMSGIGVIALAGIVVNNNIVLIDTFDKEMLSAKNAREAILNTGHQRLRPVLLTTITTILGLMPMVLQVNIDFINRIVDVGAPSTQWWVQLATSITFGLTFSTILTLIVTPCLLMVRANVQEKKKQATDLKAHS